MVSSRHFCGCGGLSIGVVGEVVKGLNGEVMLDRDALKSKLTIARICQGIEEMEEG